MPTRTSPGKDAAEQTPSAADSAAGGSATRAASAPEEFAEEPLGALMAEIARINETTGWYELERSFPEDVALIHSEASEALEAYRDGHEPGEEAHEPGGKPVGIPSELADIVIRVLDLCHRHKIDIDRVVREKIAYNSTRGHRHGGKRL